MKYEKDEINFHGVLNTMRQIYDVTLEELSEGLYTRSAMKRIESGERIPEKLMRDRLMARMGISGENYEDYLQNDEYDRWKLRQDMLNCVQGKQWDVLEIKLREYEALEKYSKVEKQFLTVMRLWLHKNLNGSIKEQRELVEKAILFTAPKIRNGFLEGMLLAEQELELLVEYVDLYSNENDLDEVQWKINQYKSILRYIDYSKMDDIGKAKIYPKVAVCLCQLILDKDRTKNNVQQGIHICNRTIDLLRNTNRLYYFVELLEIRKEFLEFVSNDLKEQGKPENAKKLLVVIKETTEWINLMKYIYAKHDVSPYMENDSHIFREAKCNAIGDIIKTRREMLKMSREELCEGICSERALMRLENKRQKKTQIPIVRELFEKLGLCEEYTRARVITTDFEIIQLAENIATYTNNSEIQKWEETLEVLEERLCMDISHNRQIVKFIRGSLELSKNNITLDEYFEQMKGALECTIELKNVLDSENCYLTQEEVSCVYNIGVRLHHPENPFIPIIKKICERYMEESIVSSKIGEYELLMTGTANYLGTMEQFDESDNASSSAIKICLQNRRMSSLATNIYNQLWNFQQREKKKLPISCDIDVEKEFHRCVMLANISKQNKRKKFYILMLDEWKNEGKC